MKQIQATLAVGLIAIFITASLARATLVMEWDYRTNEHLSVAVGGATNAFLLTNATVNTGPAVPAYLAQDPDIATGYLNVPRIIASNEPNGLVTHTTLGEWRDYFGREAFGTGTVYVVFRPHFSGINNAAGHPGRFWVFNHDDGNNFDTLGLMIESDSPGIGPTFFMGRSVYNQPRAELPNFNWDSNSWYMLGGSWAAGVPINVYLRQLGTNKPAGQFASSSLSLLEPIDPFLFNNRPFYVGRRTSASSPENAHSDVALVRVFNNEFYTLGDFNTAYEYLIIPEPGALGFLVLTGVAATLRRRNR